LFVYKESHLATSARTRNSVVPAHRSLAMSRSFVVLGCRAWNTLPNGIKILPTRASFVSVVRIMVLGVDASNWVFICFYAHVLFLWHQPRCWMLRLCATVFNLVFRPLVCSLLFSEAFANGELLCFIFGWTTTVG
jgi:hypothetical protein